MVSNGKSGFSGTVNGLEIVVGKGFKVEAPRKRLINDFTLVNPLAAFCFSLEQAGLNALNWMCLRNDNIKRRPK